MRQLIFIIVFTLFYSSETYSNIGDFQGKIKILKEGIYDTLTVEIFIKDNFIRVDEYKKDKKPIRSFIANTSFGNIYLVSYQHKMYSLVKVNPSSSNNDVEIIKSENFIEVNGKKCYQWRVKDKASQTVTTYWVAKIEYNFEPKLFRILANAGSAIDEFVKMPQTPNIIPLKVVDRTRFRKLRSNLQIIEISSMKLSESLFKIPNGFSELISG
ncbi:MAG: hypothetical protein PWR03_418 [Tenuifilum sp.]|uniref:DUF4412 domain-containing protein n=1 Tax=Tenuifilum sp. TaxID=2760880 RepID=UPI0024AAE075|nr:DUF4412 domain-containing protein [Tenuifilum sp.]MDI3526235.1 hypothetical protein [Tenuifilum sp.]